MMNKKEQISNLIGNAENHDEAVKSILQLINSVKEDCITDIEDKGDGIRTDKLKKIISTIRDSK